MARAGCRLNLGVDPADINIAVYVSVVAGIPVGVTLLLSQRFGTSNAFALAEVRLVEARLPLAHVR